MWTVSETGWSGFLFGFAGGRIGYLVGPSGSAFRLVGNWRFHGRRLAVGIVGGYLSATLLEGLTADLLPVGSDIDLIVASRQDATLTTVREWVQLGEIPAWSDCAGLSPELRCWRLQIGNLSVDTEGRLWRRRAPPSGASQLIVPSRERQDIIRRFHDSLFAGHLGVSQTVYHLQNRVYWPGLRHDVRSYLASCTVCLARLRTHGGLPWDMLMWGTDGIG